MGKGMKVDKRKIPMTQQQFDRERRRMEAELTAAHNEWVRQQKDDITGSATELAYCLMMVALNDVYGFGKARLLKVVEDIERLGNLVKDGELTWWDIRDRAGQLGFEPANEQGYLESDRGESEDLIAKIERLERENEVLKSKQVFDPCARCNKLCTVACNRNTCKVLIDWHKHLRRSR